MLVGPSGSDLSIQNVTGDDRELAPILQAVRDNEAKRITRCPRREGRVGHNGHRIGSELRAERSLADPNREQPTQRRHRACEPSLPLQT